MELQERTEHTKRYGQAAIEIPAGKTLRIETTPEGEEILDVVVPVGKVWHVGIVIDIEETDAA